MEYYSQRVLNKKCRGIILITTEENMKINKFREKKRKVNIREKRWKEKINMGKCFPFCQNMEPYKEFSLLLL